jgi:hypothetical protein
MLCALPLNVMCLKNCLLWYPKGVYVLEWCDTGQQHKSRKQNKECIHFEPMPWKSFVWLSLSKLGAVLKVYILVSLTKICSISNHSAIFFKLAIAWNPSQSVRSVRYLMAWGTDQSERSTEFCKTTKNGDSHAFRITYFVTQQQSQSNPSHSKEFPLNIFIYWNREIDNR